MNTDAPVSVPGNNRDFPWDEFDSQKYVASNYRTLRDDDRGIIETVRDFFAANPPETSGPDSRVSGVDVGAGSNLYPTFAMLPFCDEITLWEYSTTNVRWLEGEIGGYSASWDVFWERYAENAAYRQIGENPRPMVADRVKVEQHSLFELPSSRWDMGTMFFVAESMSSAYSEFDAAVQAFLGALRPGAPFAAAFMRGSTGYDVGARRYPAVPVDEDDIRRTVVKRAKIASLKPIDCGASGPLRPGYDDEMIVVTGTVET